MKLADEKRALQEISQTKRARRTVEGFQAEEDAIAADRATIEDLKKQLDDPELKAASDRFDAVRAELDALKKEGKEGRRKVAVLLRRLATVAKEVDLSHSDKVRLFLVSGACSMSDGAGGHPSRPGKTSTDIVRSSKRTCFTCSIARTDEATPR